MSRQLTAGLTLALLCMAGLGALSFQWRPRLDDTCRDRKALFDPEGLDQKLAGVSVSGGPRMKFMDGYVVSDDVALPLYFTIRRTFELPNWLIRPTTAIPGPKEPDRFEERILDVDGSPVRVQFAYAMHPFRERFVAYVLAYDGEPYVSSFWLRLFEAPRAIVRGARPITYMGVASDVGRLLLTEQEERAEEFLREAWRHYERSCR